MFEKIIDFFVKRHLLTNFIVIFIFIGGIYFWQHTNKEEMPNMSLDMVRITANYSGATPDEVEYFITKPIEDAIKGLDGIYSIRSTSSVGSCNIRVELEPGLADRDSVINEIRTTVLDVRLPDDVIDDPVIREFKTSKMAILDVAIYNTNYHLLDDQGRKELQKYTLALENQLLNLNEVSTISRSGYLQEEMQVNLIPEKLIQYNIPISTVLSKIKAHNIRQPAGSLEDRDESKVTVSAVLYTVEQLKKLVLQSSFSGYAVRLGQIAEIRNTFEKNRSITKVNGHEAVIINITKTSSAGILKAMEKIRQVISLFERNTLSSSSIKIVLLDDESRSVRNRLTLIGWNGTIGFMLILIMLFIFLDAKSGIWVAMGIPFTFSFTIVIASLMGYTINNITLAAIIIVMGMIVDDAIVIAENISRLKSQGIEEEQAAVKGTSAMVLPVVASIVTTCIAFIPLLIPTGNRFARMNAFIPPIVFLMLGGSLLESIFILPGHMNLHISPGLKAFFSRFSLTSLKKAVSRKRNNHGHWFYHLEDSYGRLLEKILKHKLIIFIVFCFLLSVSGFIVYTQMKYILFPNEEATEARIMAAAPDNTKREETALYSKKLENILKPYIGREVVGIRTEIARSRWGGTVEENRLMMRIEVVPKEKRKKSLNQLISEWDSKAQQLNEFVEVKISKQRFGHSSGTPIELVILENNDDTRQKAVDKLFTVMSKDKDLVNVEIEKVLQNPEYKVSIDHEQVERFGIEASRIPSTLRTILDGTILYEIPDGDEEIDLRVTVRNTHKNDIYKVINVPVENQGRYLVPLKNIVNIKKGVSPNSIAREDYRRTTKIYADIRLSGQKPEFKKEDQARSVDRKIVPGALYEKNQENGVNKEGQDTEEKPGQTKQNANNMMNNKDMQISGSYVKTPVEVAEYYESNVFPKIMSKYPSTTMYFSGEVKDTRESKGEMTFAMILVIFLIYMILALLFNSLSRPLIVILSIPFGVVGIILAFYFHGILIYGFYALIGALGLSGVIVNDSIVMVVKLEEEFKHKTRVRSLNKEIADVAKTRLRAVTLTTLTTVAGLFPTAYGIAGYDSMLAEMMLAMGWGLLFGTCITLLLVPTIYSIIMTFKYRVRL